MPPPGVELDTFPLDRPGRSSIAGDSDLVSADLPVVSANAALAEVKKAAVASRPEAPPIPFPELSSGVWFLAPSAPATSLLLLGEEKLFPRTTEETPGRVMAAAAATLPRAIKVEPSLDIKPGLRSSNLYFSFFTISSFLD